MAFPGRAPRGGGARRVVRQQEERAGGEDRDPRDGAGQRQEPLQGDCRAGPVLPGGAATPTAPGGFAVYGRLVGLRLVPRWSRRSVPPRRRGFVRFAWRERAVCLGVHGLIAWEQGRVFSTAEDIRPDQADEPPLLASVIRYIRVAHRPTI